MGHKRGENSAWIWNKCRVVNIGRERRGGGKGRKEGEKTVKRVRCREADWNVKQGKGSKGIGDRRIGGRRGGEAKDRGEGRRMRD